MLSGIFRERLEFKQPPLEINRDNLRSLLNQAPRTLREKTQRLLHTIVHANPCFDQEVTFQLSRDFPLAFTKGPNEFLFMINYLFEHNLAIQTKMLGETYWDQIDNQGLGGSRGYREARRR